MRSLGAAANVFRKSLSADPVEAAAADAIIARSPPALASASGGGLLHYRRAHRDDPTLRLWSGLIFLGQGRPALAAAEFTGAVKLGFDGDRAASYLSRAIRACGKPQE